MVVAFSPTIRQFCLLKVTSGMIRLRCRFVVRQRRGGRHSRSAPATFLEPAQLNAVRADPSPVGAGLKPAPTIGVRHNKGVKSTGLRLFKVQCSRVERQTRTGTWNTEKRCHAPQSSEASSNRSSSSIASLRSSRLRRRNVLVCVCSITRSRPTSYGLAVVQSSRFKCSTVLAGHLHRNASMISRLHAAYVENRDKRSESELQRWLNIKSTTHA
jgi:hypothetical protein